MDFAPPKQTAGTAEMDASMVDIRKLSLVVASGFMVPGERPTERTGCVSDSQHCSKQ